jgi:hypothetical protein
MKYHFFVILFMVMITHTGTQVFVNLHILILKLPSCGGLSEQQAVVHTSYQLLYGFTPPAAHQLLDHISGSPALLYHIRGSPAAVSEQRLTSCCTTSEAYQQLCQFRGSPAVGLYQRLTSCCTGTTSQAHHRLSDVTSKADQLLYVS